MQNEVGGTKRKKKELKDLFLWNSTFPFLDCLTIFQKATLFLDFGIFVPPGENEKGRTEAIGEIVWDFPKS